MRNFFKQIGGDFFVSRVIRNCVTFIGQDFLLKDKLIEDLVKYVKEHEYLDKLYFSHNDGLFYNVPKRERIFLTVIMHDFYSNYSEDYASKYTLKSYIKLLKISGPIIVTTRWDNLLELALLEMNKNFQVYNWCDSKISFSKDKYTIFKLFGSFEKPESLVLDENDMNQLHAKMEDFPDLFWDVVSTRPILFLGFKINAFFKRLHKKIYREKSMHYDYFVAENLGNNEDSVRRELFENKNIEFVDCMEEEFLDHCYREMYNRYEHEIPLKNFYNSLQKEAKRVTAFISYSRLDKRIMGLVKKWCTGENINVIVDIDTVKPGTQSWKRDVENYIEQADFVLAILTPNAKASNNVLAEMLYSRSNETRIFPLLADGNEETSIPDEFNYTVWVDIRDEFSNINELSEQIHDYKKKLRTKPVY